MDTEKPPDLRTLTTLSTDDGGELRIVEDSANYYRQIGTILLDDRYGERVDRIVHDMRGKAEDTIVEIYKLWMKEDVFASWTTLAECFRECGLHRLAQNIEQQFGLPSPPLPQTPSPLAQKTAPAAPVVPNGDYTLYPSTCVQLL